MGIEIKLNGEKDLRLKSGIGNPAIFRLADFEVLVLVRSDLAQAILDARCTGIEFLDADGFSERQA